MYGFRDSQLSSVLERGTGNPASMAILYMMLCRRTGLRMAAKPLDGGRYFVLWPADGTGLSLGGKSVLLDAYGGGYLYTEDEVILGKS